MDPPSSLTRSISPPPIVQRRKSSAREATHEPLRKASARNGASKVSTLAAVEAGKATLFDHLGYFSHHLSQVIRPAEGNDAPRLSISEYVNLYHRSSHEHGHHFVIHQHNHPVAGCHYDLRLQFSASSSCSFAIPYGVPGNPNSQRQGRMAIETRVHTLWNNLIESASHATGSLLIWDTGEYEVLPRKMSHSNGALTDDDSSDPEDGSDIAVDARYENEKLIEAFRMRYIRLRLNGTRLPKGYTITVRLPSSSDFIQHSKPMRRKRKQSKPDVHKTDRGPEDQDTDDIANADVGLASDDENESATIRANNAYTGAQNTISSVHQRRWFISLDRANSGFVKSGDKWIRNEPDRGFDPFYVRGADTETSVVTGRTSTEVMVDEGVEGFVPRKRWRAVLE